MIKTICSNELTYPTTRRHSDVVTTSLCTSQRRRSYVSNETANVVSVKRSQDVSVLRLNDILLELRDDVSRGRNNNVPLVRLLDVTNKSQMQHPMTSQWYVVRILDVLLVRLYDISCKSQMKHSITLLWYVSTTSQSYVVATPC